MLFPFLFFRLTRHDNGDIAFHDAMLVNFVLHNCFTWLWRGWFVVKIWDFYEFWYPYSITECRLSLLCGIEDLIKGASEYLISLSVHYFNLCMYYMASD